jgi:hypothetical protein
MRTMATVKKDKSKEKDDIVHGYGNFYKCSERGDLYQLIRVDDGHDQEQVVLVAQPEAEVVSDIMDVKNCNKLTEEEFDDLCDSVGIHGIKLNFLKTVDFLVA